MTTTTAAPGRKVTRRNPVNAKFAQFAALGAEAKAATDRAAALKTDLVEWIKANGQEDPEKGHLVHLLPAPVQAGANRFVGFMWQKKSGGETFEEEKAEALCKEKGFEPSEYTSTQVYVDQDKIARLYAEDRLTEEEFNSLITQNDPTWAFVPVKG